MKPEIQGALKSVGTGGEGKKPVRVVLADDSESVRTNLSALLRKLPGVQVVGNAAEGGRALELTRELKPDILILDIHMPGIGGMEVLSILRRENAQLTIMLFTSYGEEGYREAAAKLGVSHFFTKLDFERMLQAVASLRDGGGDQG